MLSQGRIYLMLPSEKFLKKLASKRNSNFSSHLGKAFLNSFDLFGMAAMPVPLAVLK